MMDCKTRLIFELEKEHSFINSTEFREYMSKKYKMHFETGDLYIKIINYQINKYGKQIQDRNTTSDMVTTKRQVNSLANERKYYRRNHERKNS